MSEQELDAQWLESSGEPTVQGLSPGLAPKKKAPCYDTEG